MSKIYLNGVAYLGGGAGDADSVKIVAWDGNPPAPDQTDVVGRAVFNKTDQQFYVIAIDQYNNKVWSQITLPSEVSVAISGRTSTPTSAGQLVYDAVDESFYLSKVVNDGGTPSLNWEKIPTGGVMQQLDKSQGTLAQALQVAKDNQDTNYYITLSENEFDSISSMPQLNSLANVTYYIVEED